MIGIFFGVGVCFVVGCICLFLATRPRTQGYGRVTAIFLGVCFLLPSCFALVGYCVGSLAVVFAGLSIAVGAIMVGVAIIDLVRYKRCTFPIEAVCSDSKEVYTRSVLTKIAPVFSYSFEGKTYKIEGRPVNVHQFYSMYTIGKSVTVYMDPKYPASAYDKRKFPSVDIFLIILGALFLMLSVFILVGSATGIITVSVDMNGL